MLANFQTASEPEGAYMTDNCRLTDIGGYTSIQIF